MSSNSANEAIRYKLTFPYKLLKPDENKEEEYQFEEIRAVYYREKMKIEADVGKKYENQINELKAQLSQKENDAAARNCEATSIWATRNHMETTISTDNLTNVTKMNATRMEETVISKTLAQNYHPTNATTLCDTTNLNKVSF
jgi:hypothetical protein